MLRRVELFVALGMPALMVLFTTGLLVVHQAHLQTRRSRDLSRFMRELDDGHGKTEVGLFEPLGNAWVTGRMEGLPVSLAFEWRLVGRTGRWLAVHEVEVDNPAADFHLRRADPFDRLGRWLGLAGKGEHAVGADQDLVLRAEDAAAAQTLLQQAALVKALRRLLDVFDFDEVSLAGGRLRVRELVDDDLDPHRLKRLYRALAQAARLCARRRVRVKGPSARPRFAWTGEGSAPLCPYCRDEVPADGAGVEACDRCGTLHHAACLDEAGGCTIFGCAAPRTPRRERA